LSPGNIKNTKFILVFFCVNIIIRIICFEK